MKEGRPSQTASMVAFFRACADLGLSSVPGFSDPTARHFLSAPWSQMFQLVERSAHHEPRPRPLVEARRGFDLLALRTSLIDAEVRAGLELGARQLVILGAGLDGRAFRMPELQDSRVFEVDHPSTQLFKRRAAGKLARTSRELTFVPVNFERDSLDAALRAAGHDATAPTVWIWEGVVMYLTDEAMRGTLRTVAARSAPGSTLVMQYNTRVSMPGPLSLLLRIWREPQIGIRTVEQMRHELEGAGFRVLSDTGLRDWAERFHAREPEDKEEGSRIVVARK